MLKQRCIVRLICLGKRTQTPSCVSRRCFSSDDDKAAEAKRKLESLLQSIIKDKSLAEESSKLDSPGIPMSVGKKMWERREAKKEANRNLGEKLLSAAAQVADRLDGDKTAMEAELLRKVLYKNVELQKNVEKASSKSLKELLAGMSVENETPKAPQEFLGESGLSKADRVRSLMKNKRRRPFESLRTSGPPLDLYGADRLGIFDRSKYDSGITMDTWSHCDAREMKLRVTHPPSNIWEQMIVWTDRGMLWKFPIDNEQGLEEEQTVEFSEHVFLENHLEGWCPDKGPVRHFMELVCVGLSRNHWLSAREKKDHIMWYKEFFTSQRELLAEIGAGDIKSPQLSSE